MRRMVQRGDRTSFPLEAPSELLSANFDRDLPAKASVNRAINTAHAVAARAQRLWTTEEWGDKPSLCITGPIVSRDR